MGVLSTKSPIIPTQAGQSVSPLGDTSIQGTPQAPNVLTTTTRFCNILSQPQRVHDKVQETAVADSKGAKTINAAEVGEVKKAAKVVPTSTVEDVVIGENLNKTSGTTSEHCLQVPRACDVLPLTVSSASAQRIALFGCVRYIFKYFSTKPSASQIESRPSANWGSQRRLALDSQHEFAKHCAENERRSGIRKDG
ncbi:hypothetical protein BC937DRAFT_94253 [Endogone sp. FLAS-F59071]|nr:hypothetical protein BC937DRAFT_94253 [Endogone sp. FLAS-F59071]|eukprot:RUS20835.1 hypothetical protein BC937DRAFT_94253 [Endogone sp. FLAS-F59071]